jgi:hypothetical protein
LVVKPHIDESLFIPYGIPLPDRSRINDPALLISVIGLDVALLI